MSKLNPVSNAEALEMLSQAMSDLEKASWGIGELDFLGLLVGCLKAAPESGNCLLAENNYGELIYEKGRIYPAEYNPFFETCPPPLGILISDNYLEIYSDTPDAGCSPTIKLIGDVQRFIGTYGLADHYLSGDFLGREVHTIFKQADANWSMIAGSKHVDFLINEVNKLSKIMPFYGLHTSSWQKDKDDVNYACKLYTELHDGDDYPFRVLYINVHELINSNPSPEFIAALGVLSWNEASWYRRPSLSEKIHGVNEAHRTAAVNKGLEYFVRSLGDFLCGEYPAPSFIPIHEGMPEDKKAEGLAELRKHVPLPLEITHVVPKRYSETLNPSVVDGHIVWIYPIRLNSISGKSDEHNHRVYAEAVMKNLKDNIIGKVPHLECVLFSEAEISNGYRQTIKKSVSKAHKVINAAVGEYKWVLVDREDSRKIIKLDLLGLSMKKPDGHEIVRVARKYNNNILRNFVLFMIKPDSLS